MGKLLLISILLANMSLPMLAARDPSPRRGLRRTIVSLVLFNVFYLIGIVYILPRIS
jgi:hypothetical protein